MWYQILRLTCLIILKLLFRFRVEGVDNLPKKTNFIVVANHSSFLDPVLIAVAIPKNIYWIALKDFYNTFWLRWIMDMTESLPTGAASQKAIYLLMKNKNIGLFPEGTRNYNGRLREFRRGAALFALKTGRPIVPCAILGAYEAFPRKRRFPRFLPLKVEIGKPRYLLKESADMIEDIYLQEGIFKIRNTIQEMLYAK